jgi:hypothetical protein
VDKGALVVVLEFVISLVILIGGGVLLHDHPDQTTLTLVSSAIGAVIPFWFMRRQTDTTTTNQIQQAIQQAVQTVVNQGQQQAQPQQQQPQKQLAADPTELQK